MPQPCERCAATAGTTAAPVSWQPAQLAPLLTACTGPAPAEALAQLRRLAACISCGGPQGRESQAALFAAGAVQSCADGLQALVMAVGLGAAPTAALADALDTLRLLCLGGDPRRVAALAQAGGWQRVMAAARAAGSHQPTLEAALVLLGAMAEAGDAPSPAELRQALDLALTAAEAVALQPVELPSLPRAAAWSMSRLLERALAVRGPAGAAAAEDGAAAVAQLGGCELQALVGKAATAALALVLGGGKQDGQLAQQALELLALAAAAAAATASDAQLPPMAAEQALLDAGAAEAVSQLAEASGALATQGAALRALHALCRLRSAALPAAEVLSPPLARALVAALGAVAGASATPPATAGDDCLPVLVYGLAAAGVLMASEQRHVGQNGRQGPSLAAALAAEQLELFQSAAASASALLSRRPGLLSSSQPGSSDECREADVVVTGAATLDSLYAGADGVAWAAAADALCCCVLVLREAPGGVNTPDTEGWTLLHRLAAAGQPGLLRLLLRLGGVGEQQQRQAPEDDCFALPFCATSGSDVLDLLARTRGGANALQLARQAGHNVCAAMLEGPTQAAADERQRALLQVGAGGGAAAVAELHSLFFALLL